jgi:hypothetical protein
MAEAYAELDEGIVTICSSLPTPGRQERSSGDTQAGIRPRRDTNMGSDMGPRQGVQDQGLGMGAKGHGVRSAPKETRQRVAMVAGLTKSAPKRYLLFMHEAQLLGSA